MGIPERLTPKFLTVLREGTLKSSLAGDISAGVLVGIIAVPLALAFAIASGVKPEQGLVTAIVAGLVISLLGGSRVQIGGPTGAFVVVVYSIVRDHGYDGLALATLISGCLLVVMGLTGLGRMIKFIPYPLTVGFTAGIALIILSSQVPAFLGLDSSELPAAFIPKWQAIFTSLQTVSPTATAIASFTLLTTFLWPRVTKKIPGSIIVIVVSTASVALFDLDVETIGSRFGDLPHSLPSPKLPAFSLALARDLASPIIAITLLGAIESLLSAVVADGMTGRRHRSDAELVAQGLANIASPIFGGIPATGAIARTATNVRNGGSTPVAGIVHALTVLAVMLFLSPWVKLIPMAALAGILVHVAYNMGEWHLLAKGTRAPAGDAAVMFLTFFLTVFFDLTVAIEVGVVLSAFLFMQRMAASTGATLLEASDNPDNPEREIRPASFPPDTAVFQVQGPFFFGAADKFRDALARIQRPPKFIVLRLRDVPFIDATGLRALEEFVSSFQKSGTTVLLTGVAPELMKTLTRAGLTTTLGEAAFFPDHTAAFAHIRSITP